MSKYNLKTGDILLFDYEGGGSMGIFSWLIKKATKSNITHVGMVLKDPVFINPSLKGYYVWESGWEGTPDPQDGKVKFGVQITPLEEIIQSYKKKNGKIYVRRVTCPINLFTTEKLLQIHEIVYDKIYDIIPTDWIEAAFRRDDNPQKTSRFWCSALVGYIYTQCGCLHPGTDWSIIRPSDFVEDYLQYINDIELSELTELN